MVYRGHSTSKFFSHEVLGPEESTRVLGNGIPLKETTRDDSVWSAFGCTDMGLYSFRTDLTFEVHLCDQTAILRYGRGTLFTDEILRRHHYMVLKTFALPHLTLEG